MTPHDPFCPSTHAALAAKPTRKHLKNTKFHQNLASFDIGGPNLVCKAHFKDKEFFWGLFMTPHDPFQPSVHIFMATKPEKSAPN